MVTPQSHTRMFNGLDEDIYNEEKYAREINDKMRVPKRILATGEYSDDDLLLSNQNTAINSWKFQDKIDMIVPDRIVVLGHNQHLETRSVPLEIQLDNSILPKSSSGDIRMPTPPRKITLNDYYYPSALEEDAPSKKLSNDDAINEDETNGLTTYVKSNGPDYAVVGFRPSDSVNLESDSQLTHVGNHKQQPSINTCNHNDVSVISNREGTPMGDLSPSEEILYLRRQLAKLNRRVLNMEVNNEQRTQREKIIYCMGLAYFLIKAIFWLNRN